MEHYMDLGFIFAGSAVFNHVKLDSLFYIDGFFLWTPGINRYQSCNFVFSRN